MIIYTYILLDDIFNKKIKWNKVRIFCRVSLKNMAASISKEDYLKKYLSENSEEKKKKKRKKHPQNVPTKVPRYDKCNPVITLVFIRTM